MKTKMIKNILAGSAIFFVLLVIVLGVHIYIVTRPKPVDASTRVMVRMDIKEAISKSSSDSIAAWLHKEKGVDHVMLTNDKILFTYLPIKNTADQIIQDFHSNFTIKAERYMPTQEELQSGCPVASTSKTYQALAFFKKLF